MHGAMPNVWPIGATKEKAEGWERKLMSLGIVETGEMTSSQVNA
jgi:hypothetical protein